MADPPQPHDTIEIPPPAGIFADPFSARKLLRLLTVFGPAAIVASVAIGAGETIIVVQAGSWAGYNLLWLVLASVLVKGVCVTYLLGRYTAVSGEALSERLVRLPGPRGWVMLSIVALELGAAGPLWAVIARPCGDLVYDLIPTVAENGANAAAFWSSPETHKSLLATLFVALTLALSFRITYQRLERQQVILCGILVAGTLLGTLLVRPDLPAALAGLFRFGTVPELPPWAPPDVRAQPLPLTLATAFGYVGGTVMGYIAYADWVAIRRWGLCSHAEIADIRRRAAAGSPADYLPRGRDQAARLRRLLLPLKWDVAMGAVVLMIVTGSFMMAGAAVLYPRLAAGELEGAFAGWNLLTDQAHIWRAIHPWLSGVYFVCILAALFGTLLAFPEIYSRVTYDTLRATWPRANWSYRRLQLGIVFYVAAVTLPLLWLPVNFATLTAVVAFLTTNLAVALAMLAALYLNFQLPPEYRTRPWMLAASMAAAAVLVAVSAASGWGLLQTLLAT